jgi:hypothetical protein
MLVLTVRDENDWLASFKGTILAMFEKIDTIEDPLLRSGREMARAAVAHTFGQIPNSDEHFQRCYRRHIAAVRDTVPRDRLLVLNVAEGWGPLCRFLDKPIPGKSFPITNTRAEFQARHRLEQTSGG